MIEKTDRAVGAGHTRLQICVLLDEVILIKINLEEFTRELLRRLADGLVTDLDYVLVFGGEARLWRF